MAGKNAREQSQRDKKAATRANHIKNQPAPNQTRKGKKAAAKNTPPEEIIPPAPSAPIEEVVPEVASAKNLASSSEVTPAPSAPDKPSNRELQQGEKGFVNQRREELEAKIAASKNNQSKTRDNNEPLTEKEQAILNEVKGNRSGKKTVKEIAEAFNKWEVPNDEYEAPDKSTAEFNADPASEKAAIAAEIKNIPKNHANSLASEEFHKPTQEEVENRGNPNWKNPERQSRYEDLEKVIAKRKEDLARETVAPEQPEASQQADENPAPTRTDTTAQQTSAPVETVASPQEPQPVEPPAPEQPEAQASIDTTQTATQEASQQVQEEEEEKIKKSWLSTIPNRDSSKPINFAKLAQLAQNSKKDLGISDIPGELSEAGGVPKKTFNDNITNVELTYNKHPVFPRIRDVDIAVNKGPAVVTLGMSDQNGKRKPGQGLVIEYDDQGKPIDSVPDLRLAEFDNSKPPVAFIRVGKDTLFLPINGDKVQELNKNIELHKNKVRAQDKKVAKEVGAETPAVALSELELEYKKLYLDFKKTELENPSDRETITKAQKLNQYKTSNNLTDPENQSVKKAKEAADLELKAQAEKDLKEALKAEISAQAKGESPEQSITDKKQKAKETLKATGSSTEEVEDIEKKAKKEAYSEALREEFAEMLAAGTGEEARKKQEASTGTPETKISFLKEAHSHLATEELEQRQAGHDPVETVLLQHAVSIELRENGLEKNEILNLEKEAKTQAIKNGINSPEKDQMREIAADMLGSYTEAPKKGLATRIKDRFTRGGSSVHSPAPNKKTEEQGLGRQ